MRNIYIKFQFLLLLTMTVLNGCKKYVEIGESKDQLLAIQVFENKATADAAMAGIYQGEVAAIASYPAVLSGLASDEFYNFFTGSSFEEFKTNSIQVNSSYNTNLWSGMYSIIYRANAAIEGLVKSTGLTTSDRELFKGEALFHRAYCYFNLVNFYGSVPLLLGTNVSANALASRTETDVVYNQIIEDLNKAIQYLPDQYTLGNQERVRTNKSAASALLARVYLFHKDWALAEQQSTIVINSPLYQLLGDIDSFAIKNNSEAILQWQLSANQINYEASSFIFTVNPNVLCTDGFLAAFETGDLRRTKWVRSGTYQGNTYYYPYKYKMSTATGKEYYNTLRLSEQYLIRAEARAEQNDITGAQADLNIVRHRAGLADTPANDQASLLAAIAHERQLELFSEGCHRWFDLKRTGKANSVLSAVKGAGWQITDTLFPIPLSDIQRNPNLEQNQGY